MMTGPLPPTSILSSLRRVAAAGLGLAAAASLLLGEACADRTGGDVAGPRHDDGGRDAGPLEPVPDPVPIADAGSDAAKDAASSACPSGSVVRRARTMCPGTPLVAPAALAAGLAAAAPGDVVSLAGMSESDAPCLPVVVCTPADAPTLLFSDSPESPAQDGVLYADTIAPGHYRFYVYHANGDAIARKFPIVVLNPGAQAAKVTIVRRGLAPPSAAYVSVGKTVLAEWFVDRAPVDVVVQPGVRVLLDPALDQLHAAKDQLVHAIYDVSVDRAVKVSFVSVPVTADAASVTAGLPLLARDINHQRGTFAAADVLVIADPAGAQKKGVQRLRLGLDQVDDTLEGVDAPTGDKQRLLGNYGMLFRLALELPAPAAAALAPRGGGWGGVARAGAAKAVLLPTATPSLATTTDAIVLGGVGGGGPEVKLLTGGGSSLPVDLFLVTP